MISKKYFVAALGLFVGLFLSGCESNESDSLATAQACLDHVSETVPSDANVCMVPIAGLTSQKAYVLKCAITLAGGGLTTTKIANAYKALKANTTSKEMIYMGTLALSSTTVARTAVNYCALTGSAGLVYISQLSLIGTTMMALVGSFDPTSGQAPSLSDAQAAISACSNGGAGGVCDDAAIGSAVISAGQTYCVGSNATTGVCTKIDASIAAANGNPASVALQLYTQLNQ